MWRTRWMIGWLGMAVVLGAAAFAPSGRKNVSKRVAPPKLEKGAASDVFFDDVFAKVSGDRPKALGRNNVPPASATVGVNPPSPSQTKSHGWSKLISATTLEDEVKSLKLSIDKNISTPSDFAGRGHKPVRRDLSMLATLFAIIGEFDGDVRWKKDAPIVRDTLARTASNTKAGGNAQVFNEAKLRKAELEELMGGNSPPAKETEREANWPQVSHRASLMQRLEAGFDGKLAPLTASPDEFKQNKDAIRHEAEILAVISEVLNKEGMDDASDDAYREFVTAMKTASLELVEATKSDNYQQAREAAGVITKACSSCHESYRG